MMIIRLDDGDIGQYGGHVDHEVRHDVDGNREDHLDVDEHDVFGHNHEDRDNQVK